MAIAMIIKQLLREVQKLIRKLLFLYTFAWQSWIQNKTGSKCIKLIFFKKHGLNNTVDFHLKLHKKLFNLQVNP